MGIGDPIANMLTRIRGAQTVEKALVIMPSSELKVVIAKVLKDEGYIDEFAITKQGGKPTLTIGLKYYAGRPVIEHLERVSKPGLRVCKGRNEVPRVMGDLGVAITSTPQGLMTDRHANVAGVGSEVIRYIA